MSEDEKRHSKRSKRKKSRKETTSSPTITISSLLGISTKPEVASACNCDCEQWPRITSPIWKIMAFLKANYCHICFKAGHTKKTCCGQRAVDTLLDLDYYCQKWKQRSQPTSCINLKQLMGNFLSGSEISWPMVLSCPSRGTLAAFWRHCYSVTFKYIHFHDPDRKYDSPSWSSPFSEWPVFWPQRVHLAEFQTN